jgi:type IV fimbrial biogenesis protein FimT
MSNTVLPKNMSQNNTCRNRGFTLVELIIVILVTAILAAVGFPALREFSEGNVGLGLKEELKWDLRYARSRAAQLQSVTICSSATMDACNGGNDWSLGWIIFEDLNADGLLSGGEELLWVRDKRNEEVTVTADQSSVTFDFNGFLTSTMSLEVCSYDLQLDVNNAGSVSQKKVELTC